jgi:D-erythronate 2-dehydrogenase
LPVGARGYDSAVRVVITGGAGFIGTLLARRLLAGPVTVGAAPPATAAELVIADLAPPPAEVAAAPGCAP